MTLVELHLERELAKQRFDRLRLATDNEVSLLLIDTLEVEYLRLLSYLEDAELQLRVGALA